MALDAVDITIVGRQKNVVRTQLISALGMRLEHWQSYFGRSSPWSFSPASLTRPRTLRKEAPRLSSAFCLARCLKNLIVNQVAAPKTTKPAIENPTM